MEIINLTPHDIHFIEQSGKERIFPVSGQVARVETKEGEGVPVDGMPTVIRMLGLPVNVPEPMEGVVYIVSSMVKGQSHRHDLIAPDTGSTAIRDEKGRIQAVTRWVR